MSIYTYKCAACGNVFNLQATIQEKEGKKGSKFVCPKCNSKKISQKFSIINFFKNVFNCDCNKKCCCSGKNNCCSGKNMCDCKSDKKETKGKKKNEKNCCG